LTTHRYELVFSGGIPKRDAQWIKPPVKRWHVTYEDAVEEAYRVLLTLPNRAAHPAIIYGPGCGRDGRTIP
jgi:hypothetical protein